MVSTVFELVVPVTKIIFEHQKEASTSRFTLRNQTPSVNIGESVFIFFFGKTRGKRRKKFSVNPRLQAKALVNSFSALIQQLLIKNEPLVLGFLPHK